MALLDPARSDSPTASALVAVLVVVHEGSSLPEALEAVGRQVYEPEEVVVVGGRKPDDDSGQRWASTVAAALEELDERITHVWLLHDDSIARPDALGALVHESDRVGADLAGSKILVSGQRGKLESVGLATDVFAVPASGLDDAEVDQEQYDVLRDVAFVGGSSMLASRAVLDEVGGPDPLLEPTAAALDLCQRVRLAGGRVAVIPSAEVLHDGTCASETKPWRVEAGRVRAMLKAYSPVTLAWVVPFSFVLGLLEALVGPLFGRWRLFAFLRAWGWNLLRLPSTLSARRAVVRRTGDAELFRFQVPGSARLTAFWRRLGVLYIRAAESERARTLGNLVESGGETVRRPLVAALLSGVGFALFSTRQLWFDGVADVGYALMPPSSAGETFRAYAGGWNPAGLGTPEPLRPIVGLAATLQAVLFDSATIVLPVIVTLSAAAAVVGVGRLLGPFSIRPAARYAAGALYVGGPATRVLAGDGMWHGLVAMAVLPWLVAVILHRRDTRAAIAAGALLTAFGAAALPGLLFLPVALVLLWGLLEPPGSLRLLGRAAAAAGVAVPALLPWLGSIDDLAFVLESGPDFFWSPSPWVVVVAVLLSVSVLIAAPVPVWQPAAWGVLMAAGGTMLARSGSFGWGTDPGATGMVAAGLGMAIVAGCGFEIGARALDVDGPPRYLRLGAALGAGVLVIGTVTLAIPGRLGFPSSGLSEALAFTSERGEARALLLGDERLMPGGGRALTESLAYRVVSTPEPRLLEAWPTAPREGDRVLEDALRGALAGTGFRLGEDLAAFAIKWVVILGDGQASVPLEGQLDLVPLALPDLIAFEVEQPVARAVDDAGTVWRDEAGVLVGPTTERTVRIADNADFRWGDRWARDEWANLVTTRSGRIEFGPVDTLRRAALVGLFWSGLLVIGAVLLRQRSEAR